MNSHRTLELMVGIFLLLCVVSVPIPLTRRMASQPPLPNTPRTLRVQADRLNSLQQETVRQREELQRLSRDTNDLVRVVRVAYPDGDVEPIARYLSHSQNHQPRVVPDNPRHRELPVQPPFLNPRLGPSPGIMANTPLQIPPLNNIGEP